MNLSAAIASVACPACHAIVGERCRSRTGKIADTHAVRFRFASLMATAREEAQQRGRDLEFSGPPLAERQATAAWLRSQS
jgi:hypothetical protein